MPSVPTRATFEPTLREAFAMQLAGIRTPRGGGLWVLRLLAVVAFEGLVALFAHDIRGTPEEADWSRTLTFAAFVPIVWFLTPFWTYLFSQAEVAHRKTGTRVEIDDESIAIVNGGIRRRFRWAAIRRAEEREDAVVLSTDNEAIWLPRRSVQLRAELPSIVERVRNARRSAPVITKRPMRIETYRDAADDPDEARRAIDDFEKPQPPAAPRVQAFVRPTPMDVRRAMFALFRGHYWLPLLIAGACFAMTGMTASMPRGISGPLGHVPLAAAAVALTSIGSYAVAFILTPKTDAIRQLTATGAEIAIGAFGIYQRTGRNEQTYAWPMVIASVETKTSFALMTWTVHVIPKRDLDEEQQAMLARTLVDILGERHRAPT